MLVACLVHLLATDVTVTTRPPPFPMPTLIPLLALLWSTSILCAAEGAVLQRWDFEGDQPFHDLKIEGEPPVIIADPQNPANRVMHAVLRPHAERPERSEVRFDRILEGQERWVGCRIYRPDAEQFRRVCLFQLGPISGAPGRNGRGLYQILAWKRGEQLTWSFRSYLSRVGEQDQDDQAGPLTVGTWEDWVLHLKLRADADGLITVWRNGQKIIERSGPNAFPQDRIAVKWGAYIGKGNLPEQETHAYFDDIVIGDQTARYEDVAPGHRSPLPPQP